MFKFYVMGLLIIAACSTIFSQSKIVTNNFDSASLGRNISVEIYLPDGYSSSSATPYRLLVYLHAGGSWYYSFGALATLYKPALDAAISSGKIDPIVVVYPKVPFATAHGVSIPNNWHMWTDSERNGKYGSVVTTDLLDWISTKYNVSTRREERAIGGFMMGGGAAVSNSILNSEKFIACISHSGGASIKSLLYDIFGVFAESGGKPPYRYKQTNGNYSAAWLGAASSFSPNLINPNMPELLLDFPFDDQGNLIRSVFWDKWIANNDAATLIKNPNIYRKEVAFYVQAGSGDKHYDDVLHAEFSNLGIPHTYEILGGGYSISDEAMTAGLLLVDQAMDAAKNAPAALEHDVQVLKVADQLTTINTYANATFTPQVWVKNQGTTLETNITVDCSLQQGTGTSLTANVDSLKPLEAKLVTFGEWQPTEKTNFEVRFAAHAAGDQNPANDQLSLSITFSELLDDFEKGFQQWQTEGDWGVTAATPKNGNFCLDDRPYLNYQNNSDTWAVFNSSLNFSGLSDATLTFWSKYYLQKTGNDFGAIEVSVDNGVTYTQVGEPFKGSNTSWKEESRSLKDFCGIGFESVLLRLRLVSDDDGKVSSGLYLDDLAIEGMLTEVAVNAEQPAQFELFNNYPNPFNAGTTISYSLPAADHVTLTLYNSVGQQVMTLVDRKEQGGKHTVIWNGRDQNGVAAASGVYVYSLKAGDLIQQKKLVVLK